MEVMKEARNPGIRSALTPDPLRTSTMPSEVRAIQVLVLRESYRARASRSVHRRTVSRKGSDERSQLLGGRLDLAQLHGSECRVLRRRGSSLVAANVLERSPNQANFERIRPITTDQNPCSSGSTGTAHLVGSSGNRLRGSRSFSWSQEALAGVRPNSRTEREFAPGTCATVRSH